MLFKTGGILGMLVGLGWIGTSFRHIPAMAGADAAAGIVVGAICVIGGFAVFAIGAMPVEKPLGVLSYEDHRRIVERRREMESPPREKPPIDPAEFRPDDIWGDWPRPMF